MRYNTAAPLIWVHPAIWPRPQSLSVWLDCFSSGPSLQSSPKLVALQYIYGMIHVQKQLYCTVADWPGASLTLTLLRHHAVYQTEGEDLNGHDKFFKKPWASTALMFFAMILCLPISWVAKCKAASTGDERKPLLGDQAEGSSQGGELKDSIELEAMPGAWHHSNRLDMLSVYSMQGQLLSWPPSQPHSRRSCCWACLWLSI